jgi:hypothetical protein
MMQPYGVQSFALYNACLGTETCAAAQGYRNRTAAFFGLCGVPPRRAKDANQRQATRTG